MPDANNKNHNAPARYTEVPFPAYRYLPFRDDMPHPRRDPQGHSYGREEEFLSGFSAEDWPECQPYLYGVDLFNHAYWWEAHEAWEVVWLAAGTQTHTGLFIQGLIQLAAAQLKRFTGEMNGARRLTESGLARLAIADEIFLGIKRASFAAEVSRCLEDNSGTYPLIRLIDP